MISFYMQNYMRWRQTSGLKSFSTNSHDMFNIVGPHSNASERSSKLFFNICFYYCYFDSFK